MERGTLSFPSSGSELYDKERLNARQSSALQREEKNL